VVASAKQRKNGLPPKALGKERGPAIEQVMGIQEVPLANPVASVDQFRAVALP
jgi:hypothetical protein